MKDLNTFVVSLQDIFSDRLLSVFIFGSKANSSEHPLNSNVDLFVVVDNLNTDDLTKLLPSVQKWIAKGNPYPQIMCKDEFFGMCDIYAIEFSDIKWNYQIIYGNDFVETLNVNYFDLRLQCEREIKNLILKLRGFYLEHGRAKSAIIPAIDTIAKTIVVIFRALLRLKNMNPSVYKQDVVEQLGSVIRIDKVFFKKLIGQKEGTYNYTASEIYEFNEYLLNQLANILRQVSEM
ncbi:MAG: hypothetical protein NC390_07880 [Fusobacterium sp.]|nr:hypothetical protein [Fusobacterium sp.]